MFKNSQHSINNLSKKSKLWTDSFSIPAKRHHLWRNLSKPLKQNWNSQLDRQMIIRKTLIWSDKWAQACRYSRRRWNKNKNISKYFRTMLRNKDNWVISLSKSSLRIVVSNPASSKDIRLMKLLQMQSLPLRRC
jgi:hypothetical protein